MPDVGCMIEVRTSKIGTSDGAVVTTWSASLTTRHSVGPVTLRPTCCIIDDKLIYVEDMLN
jgi:hypothetical protein